jgi:DNA-binding NtrC family response regulator
MPRILVLGKQPQMRRLISESLYLDGHQVENVSDAAMLWEHLGNTQPDLVLLDAHSDGFGAMKLFFDIKEKLPDLAVIVYQCRNYGDVDSIKGAVADALVKNTAPRSDNILGSREMTNDN